MSAVQLIAIAAMIASSLGVVALACPTEKKAALRALRQHGVAR